MGSRLNATKMTIGHRGFANGDNSYGNATGTDYSGYGTATASVLDSLNNILHPKPVVPPTPTYVPTPPAKEANTSMSPLAIGGIVLASAAALGLIIWGIHKAIK